MLEDAGVVSYRRVTIEGLGVRDAGRLVLQRSDVDEHVLLNLALRGRKICGPRYHEGTGQGCRPHPSSSSGANRPPRRWLAPRELAIAALVTAFIVAAKLALRMPIRVPGHTGIWWMAALVLGRGAIRKQGAGTLIGVATGILATMLIPGSEGLLQGVKYAAAGAAVDLGAFVTGERLDNPIAGALTGALANLAKLGAGTLIAYALGLPAELPRGRTGHSIRQHVVFGAIGGALGSWVLGRLRPTLGMEPMKEEAG